MKVTLHYTCSIAGVEESEEIEVPDNTTDTNLEIMAEDFMHENLHPEFWFTKNE